MSQFFRYSQRLAGTLLACLVSISAFANGWEHTAIPLDALTSALNHPQAEIRQRAAESLGHRHEKRAVDALLEHLQAGEPEPRVRQSIYRALGKLGDLAAESMVQSCANGETVLLVRVECVSALGNLSSEATDRMLVALIDAESGPVRRAAIRALGGSSSSLGVKALGRLSNTSEKPSERLLAITALGRTGSNEAAKHLAPFLNPAETPRQHRAALEATTQLGFAEDTSMLRDAWRQARDPASKRAALLALAAATDRGAIDYALTALHDEDWLLRYQALDILLARGEVSEQQAEQARTLVDVAISQTRHLFLQTYSGPDAVIEREALVRTRAELDLLRAYLRTSIAMDPRYGFNLFRLAAMPMEVSRAGSMRLDIAEGFYRARWQALYGIGYTFNPDAEPLLRDAVGDKDFRIRAVALRSIGVYGAKAFQEEVVAALSDPAAEVRWTAARVMGRDPVFRDPAPLIAALPDSHNMVRREAALSLGYGEYPGAREALQNVSEGDPDEQVRTAADLSLQQLD